MSDRLRLIECWLREPATFDRMYGDTAWLAQIGGGTLDPADVALLRGDRDRAYEGYRSRITHNCDDVEAWAGLALSRYAADFAAADAPVWCAPEVLMALHCELGADTGIGPDVGELAAWLVPADKSA